MADPNSEISNLISRYLANPLLPLELPLINERLTNENASVLDFKNLYYRDPLLSTVLVELAWNKTKTKANHPFAGDHAMSTLGLEDAKSYFSKLPCNDAQLLTDELRFIMSSSLLAAELAKNLCHNPQKSNQLYWTSMAHQIPDLILWYLKPKVMWRIQYRQIKLAKKLPIFEQAKLGFELAHWRQSIARKWHMSELNQLTYSKKLPDNRKQLLSYSKIGYNVRISCLKQWHHSDSWQILTANWLARAILVPWLANSYQHYFLIAKQAFGSADKKMSQQVSDAIRTTSEHLNDSVLFVPATNFLFRKSLPDYPDWLNAAPKKPVKRDQKFVQQAGELKQSSNQMAIQKLLMELKTSPQTFVNSNQLFRTVLTLCIERLGFSRACLLVVDWKNKQVSTSLFLQQEGQQKIKIAFDFKQKTPLNKFLIEQGFLLFDISKYSKIWHKLPKEIVEQQVKNFVLFSLKPKTQVQALIYLDKKGQKPPTPKTISIAKLILNATHRVFELNSKD